MKAAVATTTATLVENGEDEDHIGLLEKHLLKATTFICIVAFAKWSGWEMIQGVLAERVRRGLRATFVIGIDFYQSDPAVLRALLKLRRIAKKAGGTVEVYMGREASRYTLHPKLYWSKDPDGQALLVGSANMTSGGFSDNHELSALLTGTGADWEEWLKHWIDDRIADEDIVEAAEPLIDRYEKKRDVFRAAMKIAERRARRSMQAPAGQTIVLADLLREMRAADGEERFEVKVKRRRRDHRAARAAVAEFLNHPDLSTRRFLPAYQSSIRYWHSGGLQRGKTTIARKPVRFQNAVRALADERTEDPAVLFDLIRKHFDKIPSAGTNVLTELLHTRDPKRYPVMNRNSVAGMRLANITGFPELPTKALVDGAMYARFASDADKLRDALGLRDLAELDVLFNYAYWKPDEEEEE